MEDQGARDRRLVASVLDGDHEAFRELVESHQKLVAGVAWRYGVRRDDIEDLVNEVFIKVYRNLRQYRPSHAFSTWLYRLAANHVVDHGRRMKKERGRTEFPEQVADTAPGVAERVVGDERGALIQEAMRGLPDHYREALFLVYVEGLKVDETARVLGVPTGTVKTRLMRGRDALRKALLRRHPEYFGGCDALS